MNTRIAIIDNNKCKPSRCNLECKKKCPVVLQGKMCIEVNKKSKQSNISELLCIGCGICVKQCPFNAISIINLPKFLETETVYRYDHNSFKLHRLPTPRSGQVLGLVGKNGVGKSTAIKILSGNVMPNFGLIDDPPSVNDILLRFRGSELQKYLINLFENKISTVTKPQYVEQISKNKGSVRYWLNKKNQLNNIDTIVSQLELEYIMDREISVLSGGELQRFAIALACVQDKSVYIFDEPSSYLDVKQRILVAKVIRNLISDNSDKYVIVVEHDLSMLDYLSDYISVIYGDPGAYGVVTMPYSVKEGINIFLDGYIPTENMRFRETSLIFNLVENEQYSNLSSECHFSYESMSCTIGNFKLNIESGTFNNSEITVMLGENGTGKTTLIKILAGINKPDDPNVIIPTLMVSYKPQKIKPVSNLTVKELLIKKISSAYTNSQFQSDIIKPLELNRLYDQYIDTLSGGELQRLAICLCLGKPADVYLIDEPSAYLDSEQRVCVSKIIKKFIMQTKKTAFIIEHDFIMATYLADRVIIFEGVPSVNTTATKPADLLTGMNRFLQMLNVTFRRDPNNFRPRINRLNSQKDLEQKSSGNYFFN